jgi:hypothetical protein
MEFTVEERKFIAESYIRSRSNKTTREEYEKKCGAETTPWVALLFEQPVFLCFTSVRVSVISVPL